MEFKHVSVLLDECINALNIKEDGIYVDCTLGGAGHSSEIVKRLSSDGRLIGFDQDKDALKAAGERLKDYKNVTYVHSNFYAIYDVLTDLGIDGVDGILMDLGVSSYQLDNGDYGLDENLKIDFEALLNDEGSFFWQLDKLAIEHMDKLKEGGIYIHSNEVPLGDFDPAYPPFVNKFEEMNIKFERVSCSGHAHPYDLIQIINLIKPKLLVPIHSYRPEKLYNESGDRLLPEKKQTI